MVFLWNKAYINADLEAPLDHWKTTLLFKPFYSYFVTCPKFDTTTMTTSNSSPVVSIPFFMISARPMEQVQPIWDNWTRLNVSTPHHQLAFTNMTLIRTDQISLTIQHTVKTGLCKRQQQALPLSFHTRLFWVYQHVLQDIVLPYLQQKHYEYMVLIEDDVLLLDPLGLQAEVAWAVQHKVDYYSLFRTSTFSSCLYEHGTPAQVMSVSMIQRIIALQTKITCRLPIDMWIAQQGPWFVTQRPLIQHVGKRYFVKNFQQ